MTVLRVLVDMPEVVVELPLLDWPEVAVEEAEEMVEVLEEIMVVGWPETVETRVV
jgi:hypothetical protein